MAHLAGEGGSIQPLNDVCQRTARSRRQQVSIYWRPTDPQQYLRKAASTEYIGAYGNSCFRDLQGFGNRAACQSQRCCSEQNQARGLAGAQACQLAVIAGSKGQYDRAPKG